MIWFRHSRVVETMSTRLVLSEKGALSPHGPHCPPKVTGLHGCKVEPECDGCVYTLHSHQKIASCTALLQRGANSVF